MDLEIIVPTEPYFEDLKAGKIHVVAFAEEGFSAFKASLEFAFNIPPLEGEALCKPINQLDETGTIWPKGNLTALPRRYFRTWVQDPAPLRRCLRDAFIANRDHCKCAVMIFDFTCGVMNRSLLIETVESLYSSEFDQPPLERVLIYFDQPAR